jgi:hypothetical protein
MVDQRARPVWAKWLLAVCALLSWVSALTSGLTGSLGWWEVVGAVCITLAAVLVWLGPTR